MLVFSVDISLVLNYKSRQAHPLTDMLAGGECGSCLHFDLDLSSLSLMMQLLLLRLTHVLSSLQKNEKQVSVFP